MLGQDSCQYNFSMADRKPDERRGPRTFLRLAILLLGIFLGQFILYGPSLVGKKILLPLDILAGNGFYLPRTPGMARVQARDGSVADKVLLFEPARRFGVSEFQAGRFPMWMPYDYAGAPFNWPMASPFLALQSWFASPVVLAWNQLLLSVISGTGAYLFFRYVLRISFWPAVIGAWCYPLTGFFVLWQGFPLVQPVVWLPWILLAVDGVVMNGSPLGLFGLAVLTCLVANGQLDVAGQVLLTSGLYAVWRLCELNLTHGYAKFSFTTDEVRGRLASLFRFAGPSRKAILLLGGAWVLGLLLAMPYVLPVLEYTHTGGRMTRRGAGAEERPPVGLVALPQVVLADMYGTRQQPSFRFAGGSVQQESTAGAYCGVLATLLVAPLAFCSRRHRAFNVLWSILLIFALSWCLNIPGMVAVLRSPGLNMMSHDRLVFVAGFATVALTVTGLEAVWQKSIQWYRWMWLPLGVIGGLCVWCAYRTVWLPEPLATEVPRIVSAGKAADWIDNLDGVRRAQAWFVQYYATAAVWCAVGVLIWLLLRRNRLSQVLFLPWLGLLLLGELLWFGYGRTDQCDPALYYPSVPVLQELAKAPPGRIMGFGCLPATLSSICGLRDIRGYDGVDPARLVPLVLSAGDPISIKPRYAPTMELAPKATITPEGNIQLPPVLDMLDVRYVIFRGSPFPGTHPLFKGFDYWVLENPRALPRVFVPESVEMVTNDAVRVQKIESSDFNPRRVAYVESPVSLPTVCRGTAEITGEIPTRVDISAKMETPGLVVLADLWDSGWHAYLDGKEVGILHANHAVRGVLVPAGSHSLEFRYAPASFAWGLRLAGGAATVLLVWLIFSLRQARKNSADSIPVAATGGGQ